jgi:hypothetical protein
MQNQDGVVQLVEGVHVIMFTLHGVFPDQLEMKESASKFVTRGTRKKKQIPQLQTHHDHSGRKFKGAYTGNTSFISDVTNKTQKCFNDHDYFDDPPVCVPLSYEIIDGVHVFKGVKSFCSLECMFALLLELEKMEPRLRPFWLDIAFQNTYIAFKLMYPNEKIITPAGSFELLREYGGVYTIEEFRKEFSNKRHLKTPNVRFQQGTESFLVQ